MSWETLKAEVSAVITTNGNNEITGQFLRELFNNSVIPDLGASQYKGLAVPATNPGTVEKEIWYIAKTNGTYSHFGSLVITDEVAILKWNGTAWVKDTIFAYSSLMSTPVTVDVTTAPYTYDVPEGMMLAEIAITTDTAQNITIETTALAADIYDNDAIPTTEYLVFVLNKKKKTGTLPVYFRDFTNPFTLKVYMK